MPTPLKLSETLVAVAKYKARQAHRSASAQIEHWARIGRAAEAVFGEDELASLKKLGELLTPVSCAVVGSRDVHDLLFRIANSTDRDSVKARIWAQNTAVYEADPADPEMIVEIRPDGTRTVGRLVGRKFVASNKSQNKH